MNKPIFSVLVPVYNVKQYLDECMQTLTAQTFPDYEVILVDDGSTDGSGALCDSWKTRFPQRLRVIHQENRGLVMARAAGFAAAAGEYFVIVDSDDVLAENALEVLYDYFTRYEADMVIYRGSLRRDFSEPFRSLPFEDGEVAGIENSEKLRHLMGATFDMNSLWIKAFRRDMAPIHDDLNQVSHISVGEDLMFSLPLVEAARRIVFTHRILYYYRTNPGSLTNAYHPAMFRSLRDVLRIQRSYAEKWDPAGKLARECDKNALFHFADDVVVRIMKADLPLKEKRKYMREMVTDADFLRDYAHIGELDLRARLSLILAKSGCLWPLACYTAVKKRLNTAK